MAKRKTVDEADKPLPRCKAILICDQIIVDIESKQPSLIGILEELVFPEFPADTPTLAVFVQLVDGIGQYNLAIEIHDLAEDLVVMRTKPVLIEFARRPLTLNLRITIPPLPLEHPGVYDLIVLANKQEIDRQRLRVEVHPDEEVDSDEEEETRS